MIFPDVCRTVEKLAIISVSICVSAEESGVEPVVELSKPCSILAEAVSLRRLSLRRILASWLAEIVSMLICWSIFDSEILSSLRPFVTLISLSKSRTMEATEN